MTIIEDIFGYIGNLINLIKSLLSFYILMYLIPIVFLAIPISETCPYLLINNKDLNVPVLCVIVACVILIILWTLFFFIYLTPHRTKYPRLYGRGFVAGIEESPNTSNAASPIDKE
ncbi:MAG: hypothetical protein ACYSSP_09230 [Planctomycetota bacterium]|jgi:hypothetical protein